MTLALIKYDTVDEQYDGYNSSLVERTCIEGVIVSASWEEYGDFKRRCDRFCKERSSPGPLGTSYYWEDVTEL